MATVEYKMYAMVLLFSQVMENEVYELEFDQESETKIG